MKKAISLLLCAALLAGLFGCVGPARASNSNAAQTASGRYMEQVINVPLPEGISEQYIIGLSALDNGVEVFTSGYIDNGDGSATARYYRHTILDDGTTTTADEPWLNDLAVEEDMVVPPNATVWVPPTQVARVGRFVDQVIRQIFLFNGTSISFNYGNTFRFPN